MLLTEDDKNKLVQAAVGYWTKFLTPSPEREGRDIARFGMLLSEKLKAAMRRGYEGVYIATNKDNAGEMLSKTLQEANVAAEFGPFDSIYIDMMAGEVSQQQGNSPKHRIYALHANLDGAIIDSPPVELDRG